MAPQSVTARSSYGLLDYWAIFRHRWPWIVVPLLLLVGLAAYRSLTKPPTYQASAEVLLAETASQSVIDPASQSVGALSRELANEISLATSDAVEQLVVAELGTLPTIAVSADSSADVLVFTATAPTSTEASAVANVWAEQYVEVKRQEAVENIAAASASLEQRLRSLAERRESLRSPLDALDARIAAAESEELAAQLQDDYDRTQDELSYDLALVASQAQATTDSLTRLELQAELASVGVARIVRSAQPPTEASDGSLIRSLLPAIVFGLLIGAGMAFVAELRDNTIKTVADLADLTDAPVLAAIPATKGSADPALAAHEDPEGAVTRGYHKARSSIDFASLDRPLTSVLITSPGPGEGKTTSASNLALASSSVGKRTVLLDVDYRRPRIHSVYGMERSPGFSDCIVNGATLEHVAYALHGWQGRLVVIPSGTVPPSPAAFVATDEFARVLAKVGADADLVFLDGPPMLAVPDPHTLSKFVDGVVLTVRVGKTTKGEMREVVDLLDQIDARLVGLILIGAEESETFGRYHYYQPEYVGRRRIRPASARFNVGANEIIDLEGTTPEGERVLGR